MSFQRISVAECRALLTDKTVTLLDIRDRQSYQNGAIDNATHVEDIDVAQFVEDVEKNKPLVIYCYHGNSSQSAAAYFFEKGFTEVYSLDGGYAAWQER